MIKEEFEVFELEDKNSLYIFLRRGEDGMISMVLYYEMFKEDVEKVVVFFWEVVELVENVVLKKYFLVCVMVFEIDEYQFSDLDWMFMKDNQIDVVIGFIEIYED